jgi:hypothetical protein
MRHDKNEFMGSLEKMTDAELREAASRYIWLSAYANNNPRSDYHWMCDAVYDECRRRGKEDIYTQEHTKLVRAAGG